MQFFASHYYLQFRITNHVSHLTSNSSSTLCQLTCMRNSMFSNSVNLLLLNYLLYFLQCFFSQYYLALRGAWVFYFFKSEFLAQQIMFSFVCNNLFSSHAVFLSSSACTTTATSFFLHFLLFIRNDCLFLLQSLLDHRSQYSPLR